MKLFKTLATYSALLRWARSSSRPQRLMIGTGRLS